MGKKIESEFSVVTVPTSSVTPLMTASGNQMEPSGNQVGTKWDQVGTKWSHMGPKSQNADFIHWFLNVDLSSFGDQVGPSRDQVGPSGANWDPLKPCGAQLGPSQVGTNTKKVDVYCFFQQNLGFLTFASSTWAQWEGSPVILVKAYWNPSTHPC